MLMIQCMWLKRRYIIIPFRYQSTWALASWPLRQAGSFVIGGVPAGGCELGVDRGVAARQDSSCLQCPPLELSLPSVDTLLLIPTLASALTSFQTSSKSALTRVLTLKPPA